MSLDQWPTSFRDPTYIATLVGILALGALFFYSEIVDSAPSTEAILFVLFWMTIPMTVAYEVARRWL